jgi:hypothetical protein
MDNKLRRAPSKGGKIRIWVLWLGLLCAGCGGQAVQNGAISTTSTGPPSSPTLGGQAQNSSTKALPEPGNSSPSAAFAGYIDALVAGNYSQICPYLVPSVQTQCGQQAQQASSGGGVPQVTTTNLKIGQVAIEGDQALIAYTGSVCTNGQCQTNSDPSLNLGNQGFDQQYSVSSSAQQQTSSTSSKYLPAAAIEIQSQWYLQGSP